MKNTYEFDAILKKHEGIDANYINFQAANNIKMEI
jgi:hypothetical protein